MTDSTFDRRSLVTALCAPLALEVAAEASNAEADRIYAVLRAYAEAWKRKDLTALQGFYHDEFTLHYPGRHRLAGVHKGKAESLRVLREVSVRTNRKLIEVLDVMAGPRRGCLNVIEQWSRGAETYSIERVFLYTVRGSKLDQCWLFDADTEVVARCLADT